MTRVDESIPACEFCGYDMSGSPTGACPECGRPVYRWTDRARTVVARANEFALTYSAARPAWWGVLLWGVSPSGGRREITPRDILLGILDGPRGVGLHMLVLAGVEPSALRERLLRWTVASPPGPALDGVKLPLSASSHLVVRAAAEMAFELEQDWVGSEHLLLALCRVPGCQSVRRDLRAFGVSEAAVRERVIANWEAIRSES